jgi:hypothetical protein
VNRLRKAARMATGAIFPWPPPHERQAAIATAAGERRRSQAGAEHASTVEQQIRAMLAENHIYEHLVREMRGGR